MPLIVLRPNSNILSNKYTVLMAIYIVDGRETGSRYYNEDLRVLGEGCGPRFSRCWIRCARRME
ncbi:hypothetical protein C0Q70_14731 [Pomacea canaliculata]|uniref:Uncharacterized protein n=1 Tax=Pomacea canaliculata TaxID=400727 RepID=A0A2T7NSW0_POMCA|nr:hypothetical protein C0Q70_14731 [Pomacea canaliculata]